MNSLPACPKCHCEYTYPDRGLIVCPECSFEWSQKSDHSSSNNTLIVKDAHGTILKDGDDVTVIKDLKVGSSSIKIGTKVKNIRLTEGPAGHNIDCKIKGFGAMMLKSEFVKKI